jgi:hypothetical protein
MTQPKELKLTRESNQLKSNLYFEVQSEGFIGHLNTEWNTAYLFGKRIGKQIEGVTINPKIYGSFKISYINPDLIILKLRLYI